MADEIMANYREDIASISLILGHKGVFKVSVNDEVVYDKHANDGRYPEPNDIFNALLERME